MYIYIYIIFGLKQINAEPREYPGFRARHKTFRRKARPERPVAYPFLLVLIRRERERERAPQWPFDVQTVGRHALVGSHFQPKIEGPDKEPRPLDLEKPGSWYVFQVRYSRHPMYGLIGGLIVGRTGRRLIPLTVGPTKMCIKLYIPLPVLTMVVDKVASPGFYKPASPGYRPYCLIVPSG